MFFIKGLLFGLTLQLAVGPVFFAVIHKAIKEGITEAVRMVCGVALVDAFYIAVSFTGVGALLKIMILKKIICWCGSLILIYLGVSYFQPKSPQVAGNAEITSESSPKLAPKNFFRYREQAAAPTSSLLYGIKLTLTNPLTILFWSGVFGALIGSGKLTGLPNLSLFSAGCVAATLLFLTVFSMIGKTLVRFLTPRAQKGLDYLVGGFIVLFGVLLLFK